MNVSIVDVFRRHKYHYKTDSGVLTNY